MAGVTEDGVRDLVGDAIRRCLDELDREGEIGAESVVVKHYAVKV